MILELEAHDPALARLHQHPDDSAGPGRTCVGSAPQRSGPPGITPLVYGHVNPYRRFFLELHSRLPIDPPRFGPPVCPNPDAARLRSTHSLRATLRLVTAMLGSGRVVQVGQYK
jgi:hypothetical protein